MATETTGDSVRQVSAVTLSVVMPTSCTRAYSGRTARLIRCGRIAFVASLLLSCCAIAQVQPRKTSSDSAESHAPQGPATSGAEPVRFRDVSQQAGLTTIPDSTTERHYIVETMGGGGIALFDCDNDGKLDIAVVNDTT